MAVRMLVATWPEGLDRGAVSAFCAEHRVSRSWFYKVRKIAQEQGPVVAAVPSKPIPKRSPNQTPVSVVEIAIRVRKELAEQGWDNGPLSVRARMLEQGLPAPSRATLARVFLDRGLVTPEPRKRPRSATKRFVFPRPNDCWQLDGTEIKLADRVTTAVVLQVEDDHSRRILASLAAPSENALDCWRVVQTAIERFGAPLRFLTDNGIALNPTRRGHQGLLTKRLTALGVQPIASSVNKPTTCGKNERLHRTLKQWLRQQPEPHTLQDLQALLEQFEVLYNDRLHQGLPGDQSPRQAWEKTALAPAPQPPAPAPTHPPAAQSDPVRIPPRAVTGGTHGRFQHHGLSINMGQHSPLCGQQLLAVSTDHTLELFDATHGVLVRTIELLPGQRSYGPEAPSRQTATPVVSARGQLAAFSVFIQVGREHQGRQLLATRDDTVIRIHDPDTLQQLREVTLEAGRRYYGSGRPRSGTRIPRLLSTKT